ncbi:MOSC domain-containing protein [bacterium]|nr:MOSC domain-containing protein [bacterium]
MPTVLSVHLSAEHSFSKSPTTAITLIAGEGVAGDAHRGVTVKHRSRVRKDPSRPNLRQVHLIHAELFNELQANGFSVQPGDMGENITTESIDLLALWRGTRLKIGPEVVLEVTGLRNPCVQLDRFQPGLMKAVLDRDEDGNLIRKAGVMSVVVSGGVITPGDQIDIELPPPPRVGLEVV